MQIGAKSDKGIMRNINEDAYYISDDHRFFIIADGVGGCNAGEIASKNAVEIAAQYMKKNPMVEDSDRSDIYHYLLDCLQEANNHLIEISRSNDTLNGMGTTIIILYVMADKIYLAHLGDSRAYLIRNKKITQITEDHTVPAELLRNGKITSIEAENHPQRNVITKALGMIERIEADMYQVEWNDKDIIVLCTDGLYEEVEKNEILDVFIKTEDVQESCDYIVNLANSRQSKDNITVLALKIGGDDKK